MLVNLARDVYLDKLYEKKHNPVEVPESFRDCLPSGAAILAGAPPPKVEQPKPVLNTMSSMTKKPAKKAETMGDLAREDDLND